MMTMKKLLFLLPALLVAWCATPTPQTDGTNTGAVTTETWTTQTPENDVATPAADEYRIITVDAKRWEYSPNLIKVKKGEKVKIKINNIDTDHDAKFETMKTTTDKDGYIILDTSTAGTYVFKCDDFCGEWHRDMKGTVIVE